MCYNRRDVFLVLGEPGSDILEIMQQFCNLWAVTGFSKLLQAFIVQAQRKDVVLKLPVHDGITACHVYRDKLIRLQLLSPEDSKDTHGTCMYNWERP